MARVDEVSHSPTTPVRFYELGGAGTLGLFANNQRCRIAVRSCPKALSALSVYACKGWCV